MKRLLIVLCCLVGICGPLTGCDPRVMQCKKCGEFEGVIGGLLPGQGSRCGCGGRVVKVRDLTRSEWRDVKKRGYVTLNDGTPVD